MQPQHQPQYQLQQENKRHYMSEQLNTTTYDTPTQPSIIEGIEKISRFIGAKDAERMLQEYRDGRGITAEDDRLAADIDSCIRQQQILADQIRKNEQRRLELAPQLATVEQREADMRAFIEGFAKFVRSEEAVKVEEMPQEVQSSTVLPPRPARAPQQPVEQRPLGEFRDTTVRRPLGAVALVQGTLSAAVRGNKNEQ